MSVTNIARRSPGKSSSLSDGRASNTVKVTNKPLASAQRVLRAKQVIDEANRLHANYLSILQTQRHSLRIILEKAYVAATPLIESEKTWRVFVKSPIWVEKHVRRPSADDQVNAQLHFLRLMLGKARNKKAARDKAGKYARALDALRLDKCPPDQVAARLKRHPIEKLARSKEVREVEPKAARAVPEGGIAAADVDLRGMLVHASEKSFSRLSTLIGAPLQLKAKIIPGDDTYVLRILSSKLWPDA